ncbi:MAG: penicillin-binding protein activator [Acetobacteraceae bacterium]
MALRAFQLLLAAALCGLAGCVQPNAGNPPPRLGVLSGAGASGSPRVAILLPMSGPAAPLAQDLLKAAQLALANSGLQLDVRDTHNTPEGAAEAAAASVDSHDLLILGPLTSPETAAAADAAHGIPMLAFTSDPQQARPGVWTLGITPEQQVGRLVQALQAEGKNRIAAVLPDNPFGGALADGLTRATAARSEPAPLIKRYVTGQFARLDTALREIAGQPARSAAPAAPAPDGAPAAAPDDATRPPLPFDALLLAESGANLRNAATVLPVYGLTLPAVRIIGPATWARDQANLATVTGAWYAAPDPAARVPFERAYTLKYAAPPASLADIAYDAASLARLAATHPATLTQPQGFAGADGAFVLLPDGHVRRGLAVFEVGPDGARIVSPAPVTFDARS